MAQLFKCASCGHIIAANARKCVGCGTPGPVARHPNTWRTAEPAEAIAEMLAAEGSQAADPSTPTVGLIESSPPPAPTTPTANPRETLRPTPRAMGAQGCHNCGRSWGSGRSCQFCRQVEGLPTGATLSTPARRLGGYLLESVLAVCTLFIGWMIWALIVFPKGQTPAKAVLGMRVVNLETNRAASGGRMALLEIIAKPVIGILGAAIVVGIIVNFWLLWDRDNQELWDKIVGTVVVNDSSGQTLPT